MVEALGWVAAIFAIGSLLILERRCLGQMAVVQPLVLCLVAGWISGNENMAIWLGVSLQLFSVTRTRQIDWALCGVISAAVILTAARFGIPLSAGGPGACLVLMVAVLTGMASRALDRKYARIDGERQRANSPWATDDPVSAVESIVRGMVVRWLVVGGIEVAIGTSLALFALYWAGQLGDTLAWQKAFWAAAIPTLGAAVAISSFARYRILAWAGVSAIVSLMVFV
ncbi:MAG: hypothetical protein GY847_28300 [Proteobacteria bacterium]|nr:hypothetical protein [Pseudomonadota bacterium]